MIKSDYLNTLLHECVQCEDRVLGLCAPRKKRYRILLELKQDPVISRGWWKGESFYITDRQNALSFRNKRLAENTALRLEETVHPDVLVKNAQVHEFYEESSCKKTIKSGRGLKEF